jgi:hypothetical protein
MLRHFGFNGYQFFRVFSGFLRVILGAIVDEKFCCARNFLYDVPRV